MYWMVALLTASLLGVIGAGIYLEVKPMIKPRRASWIRGAVLGNLFLYVVGLAGVLFFAVDDALAQHTTEAGAAGEVTLGLGLALIGVGIPTALATIGAGIAVGPVGSSALAAISEKPEMFGRSLVYLGLAEGIAIYGLVVSILSLGKL